MFFHSSGRTMTTQPSEPPETKRCAANSKKKLQKNSNSTAPNVRQTESKMLNDVIAQTATIAWTFLRWVHIFKRKAARTNDDDEH